MALADLDPAVALTLATELTTIYDCPRSNIAINAMAQDLMRWCRGWIGQNNIWPPEAQARWLVQEAREKWTEKWLGTGALKQLLDARFPPTVVPGNAAQPLGEKPPIICSHCNDTGIIRVGGRHQYCDCDLGARIRTDAGDNAKRWLERMDGSALTRTQPESRRAKKKPTLAELEAEYYAHHPQTTSQKEDEPQ
jgi:hypothetical protein